MNRLAILIILPFSILINSSRIQAKEMNVFPPKQTYGPWQDIETDASFVTYDEETGAAISGRKAAKDATHAREVLMGPPAPEKYVPIVFGKKNSKDGSIDQASETPVLIEEEALEFITESPAENDPPVIESAEKIEGAQAALEVLEGPTEDCDQVQVSTEVSSDPIIPTDARGLTIGTDPVAQGARKLLATLFQSCDALNNDSTLQVPLNATNEVNVDDLAGVNRRDGGSGPRRITNREDYVNSHPVLKQLKAKKDLNNYPPSGESCADATINPPVYGYGSKPKITSDGDIKLTEFGQGNYGSNGAREYSDVTPQAIDCSGLVAGALAMQGLKINPNHNDSYQIFNTSMFKNQANQSSANTCINHARFHGENSLLTGDIINVGSSHIVMVDSIGDDPLGIKANSEAGTCEDISVSSFDFTYIHSGAMSSSNTAHIGPSRVHISYHTDLNRSFGGDRPGTMFNNLVSVAQNRCQEIVDNENFEESSTYGDSGNSNFGILRHVANDRREAITNDMKNNCKMEEPVKVIGSECVEENCI